MIISFLIAIVIVVLNTFLAMRLNQQLHRSSRFIVGELNVVRNVHVVILVDNHDDPKSRCVSAWGLSLYIETESTKILFDAGPDPNSLLCNAETMGVDLTRLNAVVISHEHNDHVSGLEAVAELNRSTLIYIPKGMSSSSKHWIKSLGFRHVIEVEDTTPIAPSIAIIGQLCSSLYEQALAINLANHGLVIVVGCSHPGIINIIKKASQELGIKPYAVIGGLHLAGASHYEILDIMRHLKSLGVKVVIPIHCSGDAIRDVASKYFGFNEVKEGHVCSRIIFGEDEIHNA